MISLFTNKIAQNPSMTAPQPTPQRNFSFASQPQKDSVTFSASSKNNFAPVELEPLGSPLLRRSRPMPQNKSLALFSASSKNISKAPKEATFGARVPKGVQEFQKMQHLQDAIELIEHEPENALHHLDLAKAYLAVDKNNTVCKMEALNAAAQAIALDGTNPEAHFVYGGLMAEPQDAVEHYQMAVSLAPFNPKYLLARANTCMNMGEHRNAFLDFNRLIEIEPKCADHYAKKAQAYVGMGDPKHASEFFAKAVELDPKNITAHNGFGTLELVSGRPQEAKPHFERALAYYDELVEAQEREIPDSGLSDEVAAVSGDDLQRFLDGDTSALANPAQEAKTQTAQSFTPEYASNVYKNLSMAHFATADFDKSIKAATEGIELAPRNYELYFNRALAHLCKDDYRSAAKDANKALDLEKPEPYAIRAIALKNLGRADVAEESIKDGLEAFPHVDFKAITKKYEQIVAKRKSMAQK